MVAALYVMLNGPYPELLGRERCWDEMRDAKLYEGQDPVVAHPPCGPWSRLRFMCTKQDPTCAPRAVAQVQAFGGVLEHPAESRLWRHCRLPFPGELPDEHGGFTVLVRQVAWGHVCEKPTWLYCVGVSRGIVESGIRRGGVATHRVTSGPRGPQLPTAHRALGSRSPIAFAEWLVSLAAQAKR